MWSLLSCPPLAALQPSDDSPVIPYESTVSTDPTRHDVRKWMRTTTATREQHIRMFFKEFDPDVVFLIRGYAEVTIQAASSDGTRSLIVMDDGSLFVQDTVAVAYRHVRLPPVADVQYTVVRLDNGELWNYARDLTLLRDEVPIADGVWRQKNAVRIAYQNRNVVVPAKDAVAITAAGYDSVAILFRDRVTFSSRTAMIQTYVLPADLDVVSAVKGLVCVFILTRDGRLFVREPGTHTVFAEIAIDVLKIVPVHTQGRRYHHGCIALTAAGCMFRCIDSLTRAHDSRSDPAKACQKVVTPHPNGLELVNSKSGVHDVFVGMHTCSTQGYVGVWAHRTGTMYPSTECGSDGPPRWGYGSYTRAKTENSM